MNLNSAASTFFVLELDDQDAVERECPALEVLAGLLEPEPSSQRLLLDAAEARASTVNAAGEVNLQAFAENLAAKGYQIWLRTGKHDKCNQVSLRHTFVIASMPESNSTAGKPELFVVDPSFQDSFLLCNPTPAYETLWEALPALFVGTARRLVPLVEFLCTQIQIVFAETASSCPPWRQPACMITKWLPSSADDVEVSATGSSGHGATLEGAATLQPGTGSNASAQLFRSSSSNSSSNSSSSSCAGLQTLSSCYAAIISTAASTNPTVAAAAAAADGVYTPRAGRPHASDRNILLSGSLQDLGEPTGMLDFAGGFAGTEYTAAVPADDQGIWGATCVVQARSPSPYHSTKLACFGASWGRDDDEVASSCEFGSSFLCPDVGGVAIKVAGTDCTAHGGASKDYRIPVGQYASVLTSQHSDASTAAGGVSAAVAPMAGAGLDMTRFNSTEEYLDQVPAGLPARRTVSERVPAKRPASNHLLRQCSALSAAIAGTSRK